jgi:3-oxoacyl-[acyl-carrier protein] reductase
MSRELAGRVALVTGVGRRAGIGAAIARELAGAGANVFLSFLRAYDAAQPWGADDGMPESLLEELRRDVEVFALELDLSNTGAPAALFAEARRRFGHVDILVNNAAMCEPGGLDQIDAAQLDRHFAVNARAAVLLSAELIRHRDASRPGRIVNITSGQGWAPMPGELAYAVTKAALDALTISLAADLAGRNITVNAVDPGPTDNGWMSEPLRAELERASPGGAVACSADTARVVRLLAGDDASNISGQILRVQPSIGARARA